MRLSGFGWLVLSLGLFAACSGSGGKKGTGVDTDPITGDSGVLPGEDLSDDGDDDDDDDEASEPDAGKPEGCKSSCEADECGPVTDGCGGVVQCAPKCPEGMGCGFDETKPSRCAFPKPVDCTPVDAATACAGKCGTVGDGCSGVITCTAATGGRDCVPGEVCGGYAGNLKPNECVVLPGCTPTTCAALGIACGLIGDACEGTLDCSAESGGCTEGKVCGTGEQSGTCVDKPMCTPLARAEACAGTCGKVSDGCTAFIDCEAEASTRCPTGQSCGGGGVAGQCGSGSVCTPKSAASVCAGKCGFQSDGCAGGYTCSASNGGETCDANAGESCGGGGRENECGKPACTPRTVAQACPAVGGEKSCGKVSDGCGKLLDCGGCAGDEECGLSQPNVCADKPVCQPKSVTAACAGKCGTVPDGCGGSYTCSAGNGGVTCSGQEYCGATMPNKCGVPPTSCTPKSCAQLGHSCGLASDGCGDVINCWPGCAESNESCSKECPGEAQACLADGASGAQSCVTGTGGCTGPLCNSVPRCSPSALTRLTGTVRTPGRVRGSATINQIPVPNAVVYIPADPGASLPNVFEGVSATNKASCGRCEDEELVAAGQTVLASAVTDFKGDFTLEGRIPVGVAFELVVKIGKWRRVVQVPATVATACQQKSLSADYTRLPKNATDGLSGTHLPKIAISTGEVDEMECVFRNIGVDESEFTLPSANGRLHMYRANGARMPIACNGTYWTFFDWNYPCKNDGNAGCFNGNEGCSWAEDNGDQKLLADQATLNKYDMVVFDCEGKEAWGSDPEEQRIESYVNAGGRMFASHYSYVWIENNRSLDASADWGDTGSRSSATGYVSLPAGVTARTRANPVKSPLFRDWLDWQGALTGTTAGTLTRPAQPRFEITDPRNRAGSNVGAATDEWVYSEDSGAKVQQLSFNTPYSASESAICGRVAYSGFHVAATQNGENSSLFPGVCSDSELTAQEKVLVFMLFDLASCVSEGDPPTPPECTPKTGAQLCPGVNDACGFLSNGCGDVVNCGGCSAGFYCDGTSCRSQECTPATCASLGFNCGEHADGCGGTARNAQGQEGCGECVEGQLCGVTTPGVCGSATCPPIPRGEACPAGSCGLVSDGCGGTYDCGDCVAGEVCGGGGESLCGPGSCTPLNKGMACAGKNCGLVSDGCGGTHQCGVCTLPDTCGGNGQANVCGHPSCTPYTKVQACAGKECGQVSDGCGEIIKCGECPDDRVCGGGGPNLCGDSCTPTSCSAEGAQCGAISDDCGAILNCGPCAMGQTCGAAGPNKCGGGACSPTTCGAQNAECGLIGDGCGKVVDCGPCTQAGESCGGAGTPNQCGTGEGGCKPLTCESQGVQCGAASDGCAGLLDCGGCEPGYGCERGMCVEVVVIM